jgi:hypothetical protein
MRADDESPLVVPEAQSGFHPHAGRNAFRRRGALQQSRSFARWNPLLTTSPNPTGFAEIVSDDLPVLHSRRKYRGKRLPSLMANESKTPEADVSDALALMVKARWVKQYSQSAKGLRVDWTDRGKLAMDALGYVVEDLGPERLNQQLWWAIGTLAAVHMMPGIRVTMMRAT